MREVLWSPVQRLSRPQALALQEGSKTDAQEEQHKEQYVMPNHGPSRTRACTDHARTRVLTQMHALTHSPRVRRERGASGAPAEQEAQLSAVCHRRWEWTACSIARSEQCPLSPGPPRLCLKLPRVLSRPPSKMLPAFPMTAQPHPNHSACAAHQIDCPRLKFPGSQPCNRKTESYNPFALCCL